MSFEVWKLVIGIAQWLLIGAIGLHQWLMARAQVRQDQLVRLEREIDAVKDAHATRLTALETRIAHAPDGSHCGAHAERIVSIEARLLHVPQLGDLEKLYDKMNPMGRDLSALRAEVVALAEGLRDIRRGVADLTNALLRREDPRP